MTLTDQVALGPKGKRRRARRRARKVICVCTGLLCISIIQAREPLFWFVPAIAVTGAFFISKLLGIVVGASFLGVVGAVVYLLLMLAEERKNSVLYLRRFRLTQAHHTMSQAIEGGLGRRYRIVTLDDASFEPLELPKLERRISRYGPWVVGIGIVVVIAAGIAGMFLVLGLGEGSPMGLLFAWPFVVMFMATYGVLVIWVFALVFVALLVHRRRVRRRSRMQIQAREEIRKSLITIAGLSSYLRSLPLMTPQATVVRVAGEHWQEVVTQLSQHVGAMILDMSTLTPNLIWELEHLSSKSFERCVFVGEEAKVREWCESGNQPVNLEGSEKARQLLQDQTILLYRVGSRRQIRGFRRNLTRALDNAAARPARIVVTWAEGLRAFGSGVAIYGLAVLLTTAVYAGLLALVAALLPEAKSR